MTERSERVGFLGVEIGESADVVQVKSLVEIPKLEPFLSGSNLSVIMDLDGVLCQKGKKNNWEANLLRLRALDEIAKKSREIMFNTARIHAESEGDFLVSLPRVFKRQAISFWPILTRDSENKLFGFIKTSNPFCSINFNVGFLQKIGDMDNNVYDFTDRALRQGRNLVFIGSSGLDRKIAKNVTRNMLIKGHDISGIFCFDTGHRLI